MNTLIRKLKYNVTRQLLIGAFSIGSGLYIMTMSNLSSPARFCAWLFIVAGLYLLVASVPFNKRLLELKSSGSPIEMRATFIVEGGSTFRYRHVELRFPWNELGDPWDIKVYMNKPLHKSEADKNIVVKVYGAHNLRGPVLIETDQFYIFPSGPGSVQRKTA